MTEARQAILNRLHQALRTSPTPPMRPPRPSRYEPVTHLTGCRQEWLERFGQELTLLGGTWEYAETIAAARLKLLARFQEEGLRRILAWDPRLWPLPGLYEALTTVGVEVIVPDFRANDREDTLQLAAEVELGLSGAEAALASTGTLIVRSGPGSCRLASLITPRHLALVPMSRLYPNAEAWLSDLRTTGRAREFFTDASNIVLISGPSRTADIEMILTLGVHGPRRVDVLFFEER
ncbi:MAG: hypothetical protein GXP39_17250 [Chloroflexi bacterium]|nr:hypothetical protein [Chloroflexota bacterium]